MNEPKTETAICAGCESALAHRLASDDQSYWHRFSSLVVEAAGDKVPEDAVLAFVQAPGAGDEEPADLAGRCPLCWESVSRQIDAFMEEAEARIVERFAGDDAYMRRFSRLVAEEARKLGREAPEGALLALIRPSWSAPLPETPRAEAPQPEAPPPNVREVLFSSISSLLDAPLPPLPDKIDEAEARRNALAMPVDQIARTVLLGISPVAALVPAEKVSPVLHQIEVFLRGLADHPGLRDAVRLAADRIHDRRELLAAHPTTAPGGQA